MPEYLIIPTFLVTWFITAFMIISIGVRAPEKDNPHHYVAAPTGVNIKKKLLWNTLLAAVVTGLIHLLFLSGWIPLRDVY